MPLAAAAYELDLQDKYDSSCGAVPVPIATLGTTHTFRPHTGDFTAAQKATIAAAMDAWSGSASRNVGWNLDLVLGADDPAAGYGDGRNSIFMADVNDGAVLSALGFGSVTTPGAYGFQQYAIASGCPGFTLQESDIVITDTDGGGNSVAWQDRETYSITTAFVGGNVDVDLGQVLVHEFGHHLGFEHHTDFENVMWPNHPGTGRAMEELVIDADHAAGMRFFAGTSADGDNVGLTRVYHYEGASTPSNPSGADALAWFYDPTVWEIGASGYDPVTGTSVVRRYPTFLRMDAPYTAKYEDGAGNKVRGGPVHVHNWGTAGKLVALEFYLVDAALVSPDSPVQTCDTFPQGDKWLVYREVMWLPASAVERRNPVIEAPWRPAPGDTWVGPDGILIPAGDPTGPSGAGRDYRLCAMIDADDDLAETSELDNVAISNTIIRVIP